MPFYKIKYLERCHREMFGDLIITSVNSNINGNIKDHRTKADCDPVQFSSLAFQRKTRRKSAIREIKRTFSCTEETISINKNMEKDTRKTSMLMDELLMKIYRNSHNGTTDDYFSTSTMKSNKNVRVEIVDLQLKNNIEIRNIMDSMRDHIARTGNMLVRQLKRRDALRRQQQAHCDVITAMLLQCAPPLDSVPMRFSIQPPPTTGGESGFSQWLAAMKMVAQLPESIPTDFRRQLWLTMAEKHLASREIDWSSVEKSCFSEWAHPTDAELGIQIVKDLHRTGCSLFCGEDGQENQALLKKVLLAYARWNKAVGYCQGFNMLAALILQVTEKSETEALKLMIYLIEGVLPDSYFADSLRGLSVDMAVFRELLRKKLPRLSRHLDQLQTAVKDGSRSYEPPLTNVFTMQWFLTLFCNCLPHPTVLRVWDLIFLEGNEILLRTALAIWQVLAQRIMSVRTADEFYSTMGILTRELLESNLIDANTLIKAIVTIGPLHELKSLREHYLYNITPWGTPISPIPNKQVNPYSKTLPLDISALKKQYTKLRQRQKQAHVIFSGAISRHQLPPAPSSQITSLAINHLLLGKSALTTTTKRFSPPKVNLPPARQLVPSTLHWKDTQKQPPSSSSSDTELCDDDVQSSSDEQEEELPKNNRTTLDVVKQQDNNSDIKSPIQNDNVQIESQAGEQFLCASPVNLKFTSDSEDDNSEFERFLADRVNYLKEEDNSVADRPPNETSLNTRRNSERALQIIQENSIILHRIMQCQSRLSPSPPLYNTANNSQDTISLLSNSIVEERSNVSCSVLDDDDAAAAAAVPSDNKVKDEKMRNVRSWIDDNQCVFNENKRGSISEQNSPEFEMKYHVILEKSKSLDERYNTLILNVKQESETNIHTSNNLANMQASTPENPSSVGTIEAAENSIKEVPPIDEETSERTAELSYEQTKDEKSMKLIQENLNLLRSYSLNKVKENRQKLLRENVDLLQSISGSIDKCLAKDQDVEQKNLSIESNQELISFSHKKEEQQPIDTVSDICAVTEPLELNIVDSVQSVSVELDKCSTANNLDQDHRIELRQNNKVSASEKQTEPMIDAHDICTDAKLSNQNERSSIQSIDDTDLGRGHLTEPSVSSEQQEIQSIEADSGISYTEPSNRPSKIAIKISDDGRSTSDDNQPYTSLSERSCDKISSDKINSIKYDSTKRGVCLNLAISSSSPSTSSSGSRRNSRDKFSPVKSPSHVFNPFPTALATRQNKEIPLKLGLYRNK